VLKVQHKPIKRSKLGFKAKEQKKPKRTLVWCTGLSGVPSDSVRCTRSDRLKLFTFGFLESRSAIVGVSRPGGSLGRRVKCRRVPQPRWVGARRSAKGEERAAGAREGGGNPAAFVFRPAPRSGALAVGGYKSPRGRGSERPHASAYPVLFPARPTLRKRALVLPFIGVRRGSRCTMGV
jgi:hypothetical protein